MTRIVADLESLSITAIAALYNKKAFKKVSKFSDKKSAIARTLKIGDDVGATIVLTEDMAGYEWVATASLVPAEQPAPAPEPLSIEAIQAGVQGPARVEAPEVAELDIPAGYETSEGEVGRWIQSDDGPIWQPLVPREPVAEVLPQTQGDAEAPASVAAEVRKLSSERAPKKGRGEKATSGGKRGPAPEHADEDVITVSVALGTNPKRIGSASHARFALYGTGVVTVADYLRAAADLQGGKTEKYRADLRWDEDHGFIAVYTARQWANSVAGRDIEDDGKEGA